MSTRREILSPTSRPPFAAGLVASLVAVAAMTGLIYALKPIAPVVSLGMVYLPAILIVSVVWGLRLGLLTSVASAVAFNWFHIPPTGRLTIADGGNVVALVAFVLVAAATSAVAELARARAREAERRREEADLAARLASDLLVGLGTQEALRSSSRRVAEALGLTSAGIELGASDSTDRATAVPLNGPSGERLATLLIPRNAPASAMDRITESVAPALGALVAIALERDRVQSEAVETAALRRSDELKTALLRAVSHDLRTPLTAIVAAGHALRSRSISDDERLELSEAVVEEGGRLSALVDKLLDLSLLRSGRAEPRREWVSMEDLLLAARDAVARDGVEMRVSVAADMPPLRADPAQLERVFVNLLENARRYSGGHPVLVRSREVGDHLVVRIVDQGPGISPADQERIFEPFYQAPGGENGAWTGSGLGLAIARGFVEANGGTLAVESLPGQGTSFVVSFPRESAAVVAS